MRSNSSPPDEVGDGQHARGLDAAQSGDREEHCGLHLDGQHAPCGPAAVPLGVGVVERVGARDRADVRPQLHALGRVDDPVGDAEVARSGRAPRRRCSAARSSRRARPRVPTTTSPIASSGCSPPHVPTRIRPRAPSWISSSITIAALGQPMPVDCTDTGRPWKRARVAEHAALAVHLAGVVHELARDPLGPKRIAGEEHGGRVVARFCAQVDRHGRETLVITAWRRRPAPSPERCSRFAVRNGSTAWRHGIGQIRLRSASGSVGRSRVIAAVQGGLRPPVRLEVRVAPGDGDRLDRGPRRTRPPSRSERSRPASASVNMPGPPGRA